MFTFPIKPWPMSEIIGHGGMHTIRACRGLRYAHQTLVGRIVKLIFKDRRSSLTVEITSDSRVATV